jgi:ABC-type transport system involved in multi-copper enzyme maturation permease subunit
VAWPLLIDTIFILILTPSLVAMSMSKEHEWGNLDMLRMTLLEPGQIVQGKFRTGLYTAMIPMFGAFLGSIPLAVFGWHASEAWAAAVAGFGTLAVCVVYTLALTLAATATCKRGLTALLLGYGTSIGALVLLPMLLLFLTAAVDMVVNIGAGPADGTVEMLLYSSPLSAQLANIESPGGYNRPELFNLYWLTNVTLFMGIALFLFRVAGRRFARHLKHGVD